MTGLKTTTLRHQRSYEPGPGFGREDELQEVIQEVEKRMAAIARIRTPEYDDKLCQVEAVAAPYAIAFVYEIRRLQALLTVARPRQIARPVPVSSRVVRRLGR